MPRKSCQAGLVRPESCQAGLAGKILPWVFLTSLAGKAALLLAVAVDGHFLELVALAVCGDFGVGADARVECLEGGEGVEGVRGKQEVVVKDVKHLVVDEADLVPNEKSFSVVVLLQVRLKDDKLLRQRLDVVVLLLIVLLVDELEVAEAKVLDRKSVV